MRFHLTLMVVTVAVIVLLELEVPVSSLIVPSTSTTRTISSLIVIRRSFSTPSLQLKLGIRVVNQTTKPSMRHHCYRELYLPFSFHRYDHHNISHCFYYRRCCHLTATTQHQQQSSRWWKQRLTENPTRRQLLFTTTASDASWNMTTTSAQLPTCNVVSMKCSTQQQQQQQRQEWTVCHQCHGEGRLYHRSRKDRRMKQQKICHDTTILNQNDIPSRANDAHGTTIIDRPTHMTICKCCQGSGLVVPPVVSSTSKRPTIVPPVFIKEMQGSDLNSNKALAANTTANTTTTIDSNHNETLTDQIHQQQPRRPIHVAIIGGGIGGLALAVACQHRNIQVTIYERDAYFHQRKQGYGLTLQQASKQLIGLGIIPNRLTESSIGITSTKHIVHDEHGNVKGTWGLRHWMGDATSKNNNTENDDDDDDVGSPIQPLLKQQTPNRRRQNIHIARQALRYELYLAVTAHEAKSTSQQHDIHPNHSIVKWNHRFVNYSVSEDHVELTFAVQNEHGNHLVKAQADIVVGADGIRSQVRQQFFGSDDSQLRYLNCIVILGICPLSTLLDTNVIPSSTSSHGHLLDGQTVFQTADGVTRIYMMPYSKTEYMWQLSFPMTELEAIELSSRGSVALRDMALSRCHTWHTPIPTIIECTPLDLITGYPVYDREIIQPHQLQGRDHPDSRRVTFVGDSIHCMSPFKGQGANQALIDGLALARCLYKAIRESERKSGASTREQTDGAGKQYCELHGSDIEAVLKKYEQEMLTRSAVKVQASADAAHFLHTNIAIQEGDVTRGAAAATMTDHRK